MHAERASAGVQPCRSIGTETTLLLRVLYTAAVRSSGISFICRPMASIYERTRGRGAEAETRAVRRKMAKKPLDELRGRSSRARAASPAAHPPLVLGHSPRAVALPVELRALLPQAVALCAQLPRAPPRLLPDAIRGRFLRRAKESGRPEESEDKAVGA